MADAAFESLLAFGADPGATLEAGRIGLSIQAGATHSTARSSRDTTLSAPEYCRIQKALRRQASELTACSFAAAGAAGYLNTSCENWSSQNECGAGVCGDAAACTNRRLARGEPPLTTASAVHDSAVKGARRALCVLPRVPAGAVVARFFGDLVT
jgi:hypothetical protein